MSELKLCPFCGDNAHIWNYQGKSGVECDNNNCLAQMDTIELWNTRIEPQVIEANNRKVLPLNNLYRNQLLDNRGEKVHECVIDSAQSPYAMIDNKLFEKCFSEWVPTQEEILPQEIDRDDVYAWCRNVLSMYLGLAVCKEKEKS